MDGWMYRWMDGWMDGWERIKNEGMGNRMSSYRNIG